MPSDSPSTPAAWHAELAQRDKAVHSLFDSSSVEAENTALHQRLDALVAELRIARSAIAVRDEILREQTAVLRERDAEITVSGSRLATTQDKLVTIQNTRSWRFSRHAVRALRAPARLIRR